MNTENTKNSLVVCQFMCLFIKFEVVFTSFELLLDYLLHICSFIRNWG